MQAHEWLLIRIWLLGCLRYFRGNDEIAMTPWKHFQHYWPFLRPRVIGGFQGPVAWSFEVSSLFAWQTIKQMTESGALIRHGAHATSRYFIEPMYDFISSDFSHFLSDMISTATVTRSTVPKSGQNRWQSREVEREMVIGLRLVIPTIHLIHWGRVTHICVSKLTNIASDNGLSPGRHQAIILNNDGILLIWPLGTSFSEMLIEIHSYVVWKMTAILSRPQCVNVVYDVTWA